MNNSNENFPLATGPAVSATVVVAVPTLPEFTGEVASDVFRTWVKDGVFALEANGFNDPKQQVMLLIVRLAGHARHVVRRLYATDANHIAFSSPEQFLLHFKERFTTDQLDHVIRRRLLELRQTGDVSEYLNSEEAIVGDYEGLSDKERTFLLINGLRPALQRFILQRNPATFEHALTLLTDRGLINQVVPARDEVGEVDADGDTTMLGLNALAQRSNRVVWIVGRGERIPVDTSNNVCRQFLREKNLCFACGGEGHRQNDCTKAGNRNQGNGGRRL